ncbi:Enolase [Fusarium albosuccineum]|uniref:phosphopyruvate hydratase n=1 Tax=Fusarium albosuccineum TaxID=1237068 RepID=A0A8H4P7I5_9HYPO|nr:Enolase [Fusarium albosuccineum]
MLLKVNPMGTVSEAIEAANYATIVRWGVFVSHRSGETTDDFIADLTIGLRTGHSKSGAPARGERAAKYNCLLDIEAELRAKGEEFAYAGENFRFGGGGRATKWPTTRHPICSGLNESKFLKNYRNYLKFSIPEAPFPPK